MKNGTASTAIIVAIGVVTLAGIGGVVLSPDNTVQILGFATVTIASLIGRLQQVKADAKIEGVAARAEEVKQALIINPPASAASVHEIGVKIEEIHKATNGLTERLIATTSEKELAAGKLIGAAEEKMRHESS